MAFYESTLGNMRVRPSAFNSRNSVFELPPNVRHDYDFAITTIRLREGILLRVISSFISALGGTSIEVYEWKESDIRKARLPNSPNFRTLTTKLPNLAFNGWSLAHAVVKADFLDQRNLTMPGLGFLFQACNLIDCSKNTIQLQAGASKALNDFSSSGLSGRIGQGLAILYGHSLGLKFTAHLKAHVDSLQHGSNAFIHKNEAMADFLFADNQKTILIESKGSFSLKTNDPTDIKSVLKPALKKQIDPWMGYLQPSPTNGYVVYSCLREHSWCPSAMFVVDPRRKGEEKGYSPSTPEQVMRENYGAWLRAMGLPRAAERLVGKPQTETAKRNAGRPEATDFVVFRYGGRDLAVPYAPGFDFFRCYCGVPAIGIDLFVLKAISEAINTHSTSLNELLAEFRPPEPEEFMNERTSRKTISLFPDGSVFGLMPEGPEDLQSILL